jgi:hypothetical protein
MSPYRNSDNGDGSGRNSIIWEVEWIKGTNGEEIMLVTGNRSDCGRYLI